MIQRASSSPLPTMLRLAALVIVSAGSALAGCSAVDPSPFEDFAGATREIRQSADGVLEYDEGLSQERFLARVEADDRADIGRTIKELMVNPSEVEGDDFGWRAENEPLLMKIRRFRYAVHELNTVIVEYATLLNELAGPTAVDDEEMQAFATDLNGNVKSAAAALAMDVQDEQLAVFSTIAAGLFQQYINSRQRSHLAEALQENQPWVVEVSRLGDAMARNTARALWAEFGPIQSLFGTAMMEEPSGSARRGLVEERMQLNEQFLDMLSALRTLSAAYGKLPEAHRELAEGLETGSFNAGSIRQMYEYGKRLERLHEQLSEGEVE